MSTDYFVYLYSLKQQGGLRLENKINSDHIWWKVKKIKVADLLEFLGHDLKDPKLVARLILNLYVILTDFPIF